MVRDVKKESKENITWPNDAPIGSTITDAFISHSYADQKAVKELRSLHP